MPTEYRVTTRKRAEQQITRAARRYERLRKGFGFEFLDAVDEAVDQLQRTAGIFAVVYRGLRRMPVRRFPYALYYLVEGDQVTVTRVLHNRQDLSNLD